MPGADHFTFGGFDPDRAAALDQNALGLGHQPDVAARCAHRRFERAGERRRAAARHLRLGRARQQRRDVMAEARQPQVDLAQSVEEEEPGLDGGVLELLFDELQRRECAHLEQPPAGAGAPQQRAALLRRQRRRAALGRQNIAHDRHELVVPTPQRVGVAAAEGGERCDRLVRIGPPFQRASVAGEQRDIELGLDVAGAVPFELEIAVPRHRGDGALEEGVGVVQEAGMARVFQRAQSAARDRTAIDRQRLEAGLAEIGLQDEAVVPGTEDDRVVGGSHHTTVRWRSMHTRSTSSGSRFHQFSAERISTSQ